MNPSEAVDLYDAVRAYPCPRLTSWGGFDGSREPWVANDLQVSVMEWIHEMEKCVHSIGDGEALEAWARLQASHHFHALAATAVQNPYAGPADGHARLMAALDRLESALPGDSG